MLTLRAVAKQLSGRNFIKKLRRVTKTAFTQKYLLYTNASISLGLSATGDFLEQRYEIYKDEIKEWNKKRTSNMAVSGVTIGIVCHYWYKFLDRRLPGKGFRIIVKKVLLDQFICSPLVLTVFFVTLAILEEQNVNEIQNEIRNKAWKLYAAEWMIWPLAQVINFYYLPPRFRILYDNTISLGYDVFTSHVKYYNHS